jgi:hypothetical protein
VTSGTKIPPTVARKLSISAGGDRKKLRNLSRMRCQIFSINLQAVFR